MKRKLIFLILSVILPLLIVGILLLQYLHHQMQIAYNFERKVIYPILHIEIKDLHYNSYYFAGQRGERVYLGNTTAPLYALELNFNTMDTQVVHIKADLGKRVQGYYRLLVENRNFYVYNGIERKIFIGKIDNWNPIQSKTFIPYFTIFKPINENSNVYRLVSKKTGNNSLRKESSNSLRLENENILKKQVDGIFCTDGTLIYNDNLCQLIYTYYYRNEILVIDTNLNLIKKIRTIDPVDSAKFSITHLSKDMKTTFSSPFIIVNRMTSCYKEFLFVQSKIIGKKEDELLFKNSTVIDVYNIKSNKYLYSFYLRENQFGPFREFQIVNGSILALTNKFAYKYSVKLPGIN